MLFYFLDACLCILKISLIPYHLDSVFSCFLQKIHYSSLLYLHNLVIFFIEFLQVSKSLNSSSFSSGFFLIYFPLYFIFLSVGFEIPVVIQGFLNVLISFYI